MSNILREGAIGMLTAGMSTRAVTPELNVNFSTISCLQRRFIEFGSTSNRHCTGQMEDSVYGVVCVSGLLMSTLWIEWPMVAHGGCGGMIWAGVCYG